MPIEPMTKFPPFGKPFGRIAGDARSVYMQSVQGTLTPQTGPATHSKFEHPWFPPMEARFKEPTPKPVHLHIRPHTFHHAVYPPMDPQMRAVEVAVNPRRVVG